jgi:hypothetical protein
MKRRGGGSIIIKPFAVAITAFLVISTFLGTSSRQTSVVKFHSFDESPEKLLVAQEIVERAYKLTFVILESCSNNKNNNSEPLTSCMNETHTSIPVKLDKHILAVVVSHIVKRRL